MEKPTRRIKLKIELEADDWFAAQSALYGIAHRIDEGAITSICSGGYDSGYIVDGAENPEMDHDKYIEDLNTYLSK